jgi:hypothetical protein
MQRLLREGEQDVNFRNWCVACLSKFEFFSRCRCLANPVSARFGVSAVGAAARAAGGMPDHGECPQVPQPPAGLKTKKKPGVPPGPPVGYGMGTGYRVGVTLWVTPTPPPPLHCTGVG